MALLRALAWENGKYSGRVVQSHARIRRSPGIRPAARKKYRCRAIGIFLDGVRPQSRFYAAPAWLLRSRAASARATSAPSFSGHYRHLYSGGYPERNTTSIFVATYILSKELHPAGYLGAPCRLGDNGCEDWMEWVLPTQDIVLC